MIESGGDFSLSAAIGNSKKSPVEGGHCRGPQEWRSGGMPVMLVM
jgi:hypothetical protein